MTSGKELKSHNFIDWLQDTIALKTANLAKSVHILINLESKKSEA